MLRNILTATACLLLTAGAAWSAPRAASVRAVDTQRMPDGTFVPESFETDVNKMMENWYLKNYAGLDRQADSRPNVKTSEQDYIDRLQQLNNIIEMPYNKEVSGFINMYVERKKGLVETMLGMSLYYMPIFEEALERHGLPLELKYLPVIESALNPNAVSKAGAAGLWQFMPGTATPMGLEVNSIVDERRDPIKSSDAAARYLKQLYNTYGDWSLAIAAYNCGPGNVNKALRRAGGGKKDFWQIYRFLPAETRGYVPAFIAANYAMNYYDKHNISPALAARPIVTDTVHVNRRVHFEQISDVLGIPMDELRILNPQYRRDIIPGNVRPYAIVLPNLQALCFITSEDSIVNHNAAKYAVRDIVEPELGNRGSDNRGEYVEELVVKYHKVKRHETLSSIAKKYGVTTKSIRNTNKIGKRVKRGQTLRINTYRRRYIETAPADSLMSDSTMIRRPADLVPADSLAADAIQAPDVTVDEQTPVEETVATVETAKPAPKAKAKAKPVKHTVRSGENLSKIAKRYGTTVNAIKSANSLSGDEIKAGQKLTIPTKDSVSSKSKSGKKGKSGKRTNKSKSKKRKK